MAARIVGGVKQQYHDRVDAIAVTVAAQVAEVLAPQFAELQRILGDQTDGANDSAAAFGRVLTRLSADLEGLTEEVAKLHARLDALDARSGRL